MMDIVQDFENQKCIVFHREMKANIVKHVSTFTFVDV